MATKEQKRKALERQEAEVRRLSALLDEAETRAHQLQNDLDAEEQDIECDAVNSTLGRAETAEEREREAREKLALLETENKKLVRRLENAERHYELEANAHQKELHERCEWAKAYNEAQGKLELAEIKIEEQALEIMRLKAKLFDLMFSDKIAG